MSGFVASPVRQMCRKQMISVAVLGMMWAGNPPKVSQPADVWVHAVAVDSGVDVGVQVDQPGCDDLALNFNDPFGFIGCDVRCDARYLAVLDGHVVGAVEVLGRVDDSTALYNKVIHG